MWEKNASNYWTIVFHTPHNFPYIITHSFVHGNSRANRKCNQVWTDPNTAINSSMTYFMVFIEINMCSVYVCVCALCLEDAYLIHPCSTRWMSDKPRVLANIVLSKQDENHYWCNTTLSTNCVASTLAAYSFPWSGDRLMNCYRYKYKIRWLSLSTMLLQSRMISSVHRMSHNVSSILNLASLPSTIGCLHMQRWQRERKKLGKFSSSFRVFSCVCQFIIFMAITALICIPYMHIIWVYLS